MLMSLTLQNAPKEITKQFANDVIIDPKHECSLMDIIGRTRVDREYNTLDEFSDKVKQMKEMFLTLESYVADIYVTGKESNNKKIAVCVINYWPSNEMKKPGVNFQREKCGLRDSICFIATIA